MNVAKIINDYIDSKIPNLPYIRLDTFSNPKDLLYCRHDAGNVLKKFTNGDRLMSTLFSYVVRNKSNDKARDMIDDIMSQLYEHQILRGADGESVRIKDVTSPQFVSLESDGFTYYTGSVTVEYEVKRRP